MPTLPGTRIRDNGVFGTITDNPLTAGATTFNSPDLADLSVVVGDHAIVTLDPLKEFGDPEIVMVTAHTAASTVATIQRGMYGTTARQHPQGTLWVHAATTDDYTEIVTSGTRPNDFWSGQTIFETDTNRYVGRSTAGVWQQQGLFFDPPACRVFHNADQNIPNNVRTALAFNSERYDTDSMHSTVTNNSRITFNKAGLYLLEGHVQWDSNAALAGVRFLEFRVNGTVLIAIHGDRGPSTIINQIMSLSSVYKFLVADYAELTVFQNSGSSYVIGVEPQFSPEFSATWIGRGD